MKKSFDAVAWMRTKRERLDQEYAGLSSQEMRQKMQESMKDDALWTRFQKHVLNADPITEDEPKDPPEAS